MDTKTTKINNVTIKSFANPNDRITMDRIHGYATNAVTYYFVKLGFYPHEELRIYSGDTDCMGGYPKGEGEIVIHNLPAFEEAEVDWWIWIVAHEIAHMYWGYYVIEGNKKPNSDLGWLTIGLGLYLDLQYVTDMNLQVQEHSEMLVAYLEAQKVDNEIDFDLSSSQIDALRFDYNYAINHGKALRYILDIEKSLGKEPFMDFYSDLLQSYAHKSLTPLEFKNALEAYKNLKS